MFCCCLIIVMYRFFPLKINISVNPVFKLKASIYFLAEPIHKELHPYYQLEAQGTVSPLV